MRAPDRQFRLVFRTPAELVLDTLVDGLRVPCISGMVGVRPGGEDMVLAIENGLVLVHGPDAPRFAVTAGGLLDVRSESVTLLSPLVLVGDSPDTLIGALERALEDPDSELASRRRFAELERRIAHELRDATASGGSR